MILNYLHFNDIRRHFVVRARAHMCHVPVDSVDDEMISRVCVRVMCGQRDGYYIILYYKLCYDDGRKVLRETLNV